MDPSYEHLSRLGWSEFFANAFRSHEPFGWEPGRIISEQKGLYRIDAGLDVLNAQIAGKLRSRAATRGDLPAVGDWVALQRGGEGSRAIIHAILPRKSKFARKAAGARTEEQIVSANVDTVFLVAALNQDFNLRRIERYLVLARESGARPVIVLSKADLCAGVDERLQEVQAVASGAPVHAISVVDQKGIDAIRAYLRPGETVALLGSSGVGKSTLINFLAGRDLQRVREIRESDGRGKHTTSMRELIALPQGGLILDTPGMRELQLWDAQSGIRSTFDEIEALAAQCQFRDCQHRNEPQCAVRDALETETLDAARFDSYQKLRKEARYLERRQDKNLELNEKKKWKKLCKEASRRGKRNFEF